MIRTVVFCLLFLLGLPVFSQSSRQQLKTKPNVIYIYADDLGYGELGSYGQQKIKTPNLDRLAKEGMRFTQHYTSTPVCAPVATSHKRTVLSTPLVANVLLSGLKANSRAE